MKILLIKVILVEMTILNQISMFANSEISVKSTYRYIFPEVIYFYQNEIAQFNSSIYFSNEL